MTERSQAITHGKFLTFEGGEGAGKSTQIKFVASYLREKGIECFLTREPGGSIGAEKIRQLLVTGDPEQWDALTEYLLFSAARRDHLVKTVLPKLSQGIWVLSDRYQDSSHIYQGVARGVDSQIIQQIYQAVAGDFRPNLTFLFDLPAEIGLQRAKGRGDNEDRFEKMDQSLHERIRSGFLELAKQDAERFRIINANQSVENVSQQLRDILNSIL